MIKNPRKLVTKIKCVPNTSETKNLWPVNRTAVMECGHTRGLGYGYGDARDSTPKRMACCECWEVAPAGSEAAFELIEALESEPHVGMTESAAIWDAYAKLARSLGGKPMRKWWKRKNKKPLNGESSEPGANRKD